MRRKENCEKCDNTHSASSLHRSMEDHKMLCHKCYSIENKNRKELKLKLLRDFDKGLSSSTEKTKRLSRVARMFKFSSGLIRGSKR